MNFKATSSNLLHFFLFLIGGVTLPFSRYLYSKVRESEKKFSRLILNQGEIDFLNYYNINFYPLSKPDTYCVDCDKLRELFCN